MLLDINQSPGKRKTSLADIIEFSANPHELGRTLLLGKRGFKLRRGRTERVDFRSTITLDRIPIIASLFKCWIFGSVLEVTGSRAASCVAERSIIKKLYASV
ncbi:hypothetical protein AVEN_123038-1 [Araneus ventricosus]|uniref:Uncharacterized protein n=1 Tax=Araneus ventricosus TaxID=182803 RepID=A0A4Y2KDT3_ARAVE|nr:hypothetical protein AVEN_123038-1 [Araneus ventricosus]